MFSIAYEGGTPFQQSVWNTLLEIPFGEVWTYNEVTHRVSEKIGRKPPLVQSQTYWEKLIALRPMS